MKPSSVDKKMKKAIKSVQQNIVEDCADQVIDVEDPNDSSSEDAFDNTAACVPRRIAHHSKQGTSSDVNDSRMRGAHSSSVGAGKHNAAQSDEDCDPNDLLTLQPSAKEKTASRATSVRRDSLGYMKSPNDFAAEATKTLTCHTGIPANYRIPKKVVSEQNVLPKSNAVPASVNKTTEQSSAMTGHLEPGAEHKRDLKSFVGKAFSSVPETRHHNESKMSTYPSSSTRDYTQKQCGKSAVTALASRLYPNPKDDAVPLTSAYANKPTAGLNRPNHELVSGLGGRRADKQPPQMQSRSSGREAGDDDDVMIFDLVKGSTVAAHQRSGADAVGTRRTTNNSMSTDTDKQLGNNARTRGGESNQHNSYFGNAYDYLDKQANAGSGLASTSFYGAGSSASPPGLDDSDIQPDNEPSSADVATAIRASTIAASRKKQPVIDFIELDEDEEGDNPETAASSTRNVFKYYNGLNTMSGSGFECEDWCRDNSWFQSMFSMLQCEPGWHCSYVPKYEADHRPMRIEARNVLCLMPPNYTPESTLDFAALYINDHFSMENSLDDVPKKKKNVDDSDDAAVVELSDSSKVRQTAAKYSAIDAGGGENSNSSYRSATDGGASNGEAGHAQGKDSSELFDQLSEPLEQSDAEEGEILDDNDPTEPKTGDGNFYTTAYDDGFSVPVPTKLFEADSAHSSSQTSSSGTVVTKPTAAAARNVSCAAETGAEQVDADDDDIIILPAEFETKQSEGNAAYHSTTSSTSTYFDDHHKRNFAGTAASSTDYARKPIHPLIARRSNLPEPDDGWNHIQKAPSPLKSVPIVALKESLPVMSVTVQQNKSIVGAAYDSADDTDNTSATQSPAPAAATHYVPCIIVMQPPPQPQSKFSTDTNTTMAASTVAEISSHDVSTVTSASCLTSNMPARHFSWQQLLQNPQQTTPVSGALVNEYISPDLQRQLQQQPYLSPKHGGVVCDQAVSSRNNYSRYAANELPNENAGSLLSSGPQPSNFNPSAIKDRRSGFQPSTVSFSTPSVSAGGLATPVLLNHDSGVYAQGTTGSWMASQSCYPQQSHQFPTSQQHELQNIQQQQQQPAHQTFQQQRDENEVKFILETQGQTAEPGTKTASTGSHRSYFPSKSPHNNSSNTPSSSPGKPITSSPSLRLNVSGGPPRVSSSNKSIAAAGRGIHVPSATTNENVQHAVDNQQHLRALDPQGRKSRGKARLPTTFDPAVVTFQQHRQPDGQFTTYGRDYPYLPADLQERSGGGGKSRRNRRHKSSPKSFTANKNNVRGNHSGHPKQQKMQQYMTNNKNPAHDDDIAELHTVKDDDADDEVSDDDDGAADGPQRRSQSVQLDGRVSDARNTTANERSRRASGSRRTPFKNFNIDSSRGANQQEVSTPRTNSERSGKFGLREHWNGYTNSNMTTRHKLFNRPDKNEEHQQKVQANEEPPALHHTPSGSKSVLKTSPHTSTQKNTSIASTPSSPGSVPASDDGGRQVHATPMRTRRARKAVASQPSTSSVEVLDGEDAVNIEGDEEVDAKYNIVPPKSAKKKFFEKPPICSAPKTTTPPKVPSQEELVEKKSVSSQTATDVVSVVTNLSFTRSPISHAATGKKPDSSPDCSQSSTQAVSNYQTSNKQREIISLVTDGIELDVAGIIVIAEAVATTPSTSRSYAAGRKRAVVDSDESQSKTVTAAGRLSKKPRSDEVIDLSSSDEDDKKTTTAVAPIQPESVRSMPGINDHHQQQQQQQQQNTEIATSANFHVSHVESSPSAAKLPHAEVGNECAVSEAASTDVISLVSARVKRTSNGGAADTKNEHSPCATNKRSSGSSFVEHSPKEQTEADNAIDNFLDLVSNTEEVSTSQKANLFDNVRPQAQTLVEGDAALNEPNFESQSSSSIVFISSPHNNAASALDDFDAPSAGVQDAANDTSNVLHDGRNIGGEQVDAQIFVNDDIHSNLPASIEETLQKQVVQNDEEIVKNDHSSSAASTSNCTQQQQHQQVNGASATSNSGSEQDADNQQQLPPDPQQHIPPILEYDTNQTDWAMIRARRKFYCVPATLTNIAMTVVRSEKTQQSVHKRYSIILRKWVEEMAQHANIFLLKALFLPFCIDDHYILLVVVNPAYFLECLVYRGKEFMKAYMRTILNYPGRAALSKADFDRFIGEDKEVSVQPCFLYLDSMKSLLTAARKTEALKCSLRILDITWTHFKYDTEWCKIEWVLKSRCTAAPIRSCEPPQQVDSFNCGLFVIYFVERLMMNWIKALKIDAPANSKQNTDIKQLINSHLKPIDAEGHQLKFLRTLWMYRIFSIRTYCSHDHVHALTMPAVDERKVIILPRKSAVSAAKPPFKIAKLGAAGRSSAAVQPSIAAVGDCSRQISTANRSCGGQVEELNKATTATQPLLFNFTQPPISAVSESNTTTSEVKIYDPLSLSEYFYTMNFAADMEDASDVPINGAASPVIVSKSKPILLVHVASDSDCDPPVGQKKDNTRKCRILSTDDEAKMWSLDDDSVAASFTGPKPPTVRAHHQLSDADEKQKHDSDYDAAVAVENLTISNKILSDSETVSTSAENLNTDAVPMDISCADATQSDGNAANDDVDMDVQEDSLDS